jgi:hypothetical protein
VSKRSGCMPLIAIRGKTECPRRVSVSQRVGFDSHRLHQFALRVGRLGRHEATRNVLIWFILADSQSDGDLACSAVNELGLVAQAHPVWGVAEDVEDFELEFVGG